MWNHCIPAWEAKFKWLMIQSVDKKIEQLGLPAHYTGENAKWKTTLESNLTVSYEVKHILIVWSSKPTWRSLPWEKWKINVRQRLMEVNVNENFISNNSKLETSIWKKQEWMNIKLVQSCNGMLCNLKNKNTQIWEVLGKIRTFSHVKFRLHPRVTDRF